MTVGTLDRAKLVRILGMLGSDAPGEVAAAGRAANAMLQKAGIFWADIIVRSDPAAAPIDVDALIRFSLDWGGALSAWEMQFLRSITPQRHRLSDKQIETIEKIAAKAARYSRNFAL
jgi:hypothetical protein